MLSELCLGAIADEHRMARRRPSDEPPELPIGSRVWTMDGDGTVSSTWSWADNASWWSACGWRAEDELGNPVDETSDDCDVDLDGESASSDQAG